MEQEREKQVFMKQLKGEPIGTDSFGNALFVGDILVYATTSNQAATLKFGRIVRLLEKDAHYYDRDGNRVKRQFVKVQVRTITKSYYEGKWEVGGLGMPNTKNAFLMKDPPQEVIDLLEQFENEKGDKR